MPKLQTIITLICFTIVAKSQSLQKEFESKRWYVTGTFFNQNPLVFKSSEFKDNDGDVVFIKGNVIKWHGITRESSFDSQGNEIGPGIEYTDSTFTYTFKKDLVKLLRYLPATKEDAEVKFYLYYKIETLEDKKVYQFKHITSEEFNK